MARDPNIPLFLWVAAAIVAHLTWGGGADQVAEVFEERADVRRFAAAVQQHLQRRTSVEIALFDESDAPPVEDPRENDPSVTDAPPDDTAADPEKQKEDRREPEKDAEQPEPEREKARVEPPPVKPEQPEPAKAAEEKDKPKKDEPAPEKKPELDRPKVQVPQRVAVVQHVKDKNQEDNPDAEFIGDDANRVQEQTQARITATDQDNPEPTPGSHHSGPTDEPGDSHVTDIAQSDDSPGELNRAPSEDKLAAKSEVSVSQPNGVPEVAGVVRGGPSEADPGSKGQQAQAAQAAAAAMPATEATAGGPWQVAEEREERLARAAQAARRHRAATPAGNPDRPLDFLGLGAEGRTEKGLNLNLTPGTALAAIGQDQLAREIRADGERRRSQHQGSWKAVGIERWRPAIENYVATVKLGNQTALNSARVPFASYLNRIHNRLHPIFAVNYLGFLDGLPGSAGLHDNDMKTNLEIVLSQSNGSVVKMGVTATSGVTAFDISALESVQRASPFGAPPPSIVSPDGNVYLHWEFHRNPLLACSTYFARPYIIKVPQKTAPTPTDPAPAPFGPEENQTPAKQGKNAPVPTEPREAPTGRNAQGTRLTSYAAR